MKFEKITKDGLNVEWVELVDKFIPEVSMNGPYKSFGASTKCPGRLIFSNFYCNYGLARILAKADGQQWIRVKITFVHDDEPDTHTTGWMLLESDKNLTYQH